MVPDATPGGAAGTQVGTGGTAGSGGAGGGGGTAIAGAAGENTGDAGGTSGAGGSTTDGSSDARTPPMNIDSGGGNNRPDAARDAATSPADADLPYSPCPPKGTPCVIMPLGDSITQGAFSTQGGGYRLPLFRLALRDMKSITFVGDAPANGPAMVDGVPFPRANEGWGGYTIDMTAGRQGISPLVQASMTKNKPHIITLMIGTNDVGLSVDNLPTRLGNLVDLIISTDPKVLVVLAQIVPTATAANNARVRAYNVIVADVAKARADAGKHVALVDMYTPFVNAAGFPTSILADDLHPNDAGYAILAQVWYDKLKPVLP